MWTPGTPDTSCFRQARAGNALATSRNSYLQVVPKRTEDRRDVSARIASGRNSGLSVSPKGHGRRPRGMGLAASAMAAHADYGQARRAARARTPPERGPIRTGHAGPAPKRPRDGAAGRPGRASSGRTSRSHDATRGGGRRGRRRGVHRGRAAHPSARVGKSGLRAPSNGWSRQRREAHQRSRESLLLTFRATRGFARDSRFQGS